MADYQLPAIPGLLDKAPNTSPEGISSFLDMLNKDSGPGAHEASHGAVPTTLTGNETPEPAAAPSASPVQAGQTGADLGIPLLSNIFASQEAQVKAEGEASQETSGVIGTNQAAQDAAYNAILKARQNMIDINTFGGPTSPLVKVLSLFDHKYSTVDNQLEMENAQTTAQQAAERAKTQLDIIAQKPRSAELATQLAKDKYTLFSDYRKNFIADQQLVNERNKANIEAARTLLEMGKDQREQVKDSVDRLPTQVVVGELAKIDAGKPSPYLPIAGLLRKRLDNEQQAELGIQQTKEAVIKGDRENATAGMTLTLSHMPSALVRNAIDTATKSGDVNIHIGKLSFPTTLAMDAFAKTQKTEQDYEAAATAELAHEVQLPERHQQLMGALSMLSSATSQAGTEMRVLNSTLTGVDTSTYDGIKKASAIIDNSKSRVDSIAAEVAAQYKSKEAQAAVKAAVSNGGKFDKPGADSVVADSLGNLPTAGGHLLQPAYSFLNTKFAQAASKTPLTTGQAGKIDINSLLSGMQKDSIETTKEKVLTDPAVRDQEAKLIEPIMQTQVFKSTVANLAQAKDADPVWKQIVQSNYAPFRNKMGQFDFKQATDYLARAGLASNNKMDYIGVLQNALESGLGKDPFQFDPSVTLTDRAELARIYGQDPAGLILGKLVNAMRQNAALSQQQLQQALQADLGGKTAGSFLPDNPYTPVPDTALWQAGATIPSATGVPGWTVNDVIKRFGKPPAQPLPTGR